MNTYKQAPTKHTVANPPPLSKGVDVKTQKLEQKKKADPTSFVIESTKLEPVAEIKGTPKIIKEAETVKPVVNTSTSKLQQKPKLAPQEFTIETIKMDR